MSPTSQFDSPSPSEMLLQEAVQRWLAGEEPNALAVMEQHPHLLRDTSARIDFAYEEYMARLKHGESPGIDAFCEKFSWDIREELRDLLLVDQKLRFDPSRYRLYPEAGETFENFRLAELLGKGAAGRVFLATDTTLGDRRVVVKISPYGLKEAAIIGAFEHPNIAKVRCAVWEDQSSLSGLCMDYQAGATLAQALQRLFRANAAAPTHAGDLLQAVAECHQSLPPCPMDDPPVDLSRRSYTQAVIQLGIQLTDALAYVHGRGYIHGDIKPSNILMTPAARPLLADFNLSCKTTTQKAPGGTLGYLSPEGLRQVFHLDQHAEAVVDHRSDVYSLGLVLYESLCGKLPFASCPSTGQLAHHEQAQLAKRLLNEQRLGPPPLQQANSEVPEEAAYVVEQCLRFDPARRPQSAREVQDKLNWLWDARPLIRSARRPAPVRRFSRHVWAAVCLAALVVAGAAWWMTALLGGPAGGQSLLRQGWSLYLQDQPREAAVILTKSVQQEAKTRVAARFARARAYQAIGEHGPAEADYLAAYREAPRSEIAACLAYATAMLEAYDRSAAWSKEAVGKGDASAAALSNYGLTLFKLGRISQAREALDRAIRMDPSLHPARRNRVATVCRVVVHEQRLEPADMDVAFEDIEAILNAKQGSASFFVDAAVVFAFDSYGGADESRKESSKAKALDLFRMGIERGWKAGDEKAWLSRLPWLERVAPGLLERFARWRQQPPLTDNSPSDLVDPYKDSYLVAWTGRHDRND